MLVALPKWVENNNLLLSPTFCLNWYQNPARMPPPCPFVGSPGGWQIFGTCCLIQWNSWTVKSQKNLSCLCNDARESLSCLRLLGHRPFTAKILLCALLLLCFLIGGILLKFQARYPVSQSGRRCGETCSQQLRQHMDSRCGTVGGRGPEPVKPWWEVALCVGGVENYVWFEITHNRNS